MKNNTKQTLKIYWQHTKNHRCHFFVVLFGLILISVISVVEPWIYKKFFDLLVSQHATFNSLIQLIYVIAGLAFCSWILWRVTTFVTAVFQPQVMAELANTAFKHLHKHSFAYFSGTFIGSLVKKVNRFVDAYERITDLMFWNFVRLIIELSLITIILFIKNHTLGLTLVVWIVVFLGLNAFTIKYRMKYDLARNLSESEASSDLADTLTNNANVKLFNSYWREVDLFRKLQDTVAVLRRKTWNVEILFESIQGFLSIGLEIGVMVIAIYLWKNNKFSVGDFVLLQSYLLIIFRQIWDIGRLLRAFYHGLSDAAEMTEIFNTPHEIQDIKNAKNLVIDSGEIEFRNVTFSYNQTREIIDKFNLIVKPKEKLGVVGPSGSGKTTMIKLILRMYELTAGKILIDGQNIAKVKQESLWASASMVPQDPILFHRTLMENIRYGKPDATDEEVYDAARLAHCHEFIYEFPDGYNTYVGERGMKLSGGERQRVAIARAILRNAPILILDEATSSLDSESERLIQDALDNLMRDKTVIVIAHRLSTIMKMDRIVVIDGGAIIEDGTHTKLLKRKDGIYRKLWNLQAGGFIQ